MKTLDEFVMIRDKMLSPELSAALMDEYENSDDSVNTPSTDGGCTGGNYPASTIPITHTEITRRSPSRTQLALDVVASLRAAFNQYHAKFSRREQGLNFLHIDSLVGLRLIRYQTGQYMANHTDKYPDTDTGTVLWPAVTFTINVNEGYEGGELVPLDGDIVFKGKAGEGVIFPANFMYPHSVEKVTHGTRYSLAGWFR